MKKCVNKCKFIYGILLFCMMAWAVSSEDVWADNLNGVGNNEYWNDTTLTSITVAGSSTDVIGDGAFAGCSNLTELNLENFHGTIGENAFENCESLTVITTGSNPYYKYDSNMGLTYTDPSTNETTLIYSNKNMNNGDGTLTITSNVDNVKNGALYNQNVESITFDKSSTTIGTDNHNNALTTVYTSDVDGTVGIYYTINHKTVIATGGAPSSTPTPTTTPSPTTTPTITPTSTITPTPSSNPTVTPTQNNGSSSGGSTNYPSSSYVYKPYKEGHIKLYADGTSGSLESHVFGEWTVSKKSLSGSVASNVTKLSDVTYYVPGSNDVSVKSIAESKANEAKDAAYSLLNISTGSYSVEKVFNVTGTVKFPVDITFYTSAIKKNSNVAVLHQKSDGKWESLPVKDVAAGEVTATFKSFSPVAIVIYSSAATSDTVMTRKCTMCGYEEVSVTKQTNYNVGANGTVQKEHVKDNTPTTADGDLNPLVYLIIALSLGGISVILYGRRKKFEIIAKNKK